VISRHYGWSITGTSLVARALLAAVAVGALLGGVASAAPRASVTEIEGEVMCPICGTLLELSDSPQAQREKAYIARLAAAGRTQAEIKDALVAQYGPSVLAQPKASGFDLSAYLVPAIAIGLAVVALAFSVRRWRRATSPAATASAPNGAEAERLEADISRYDL